MNWIFNLFEPEGDPDGSKNTQAMAKLGEQVARICERIAAAPWHNTASPRPQL